MKIKICLCNDDYKNAEEVELNVGCSVDVKGSVATINGQRLYADYTIDTRYIPAPRTYEHPVLEVWCKYAHEETKMKRLKELKGVVE